MTARPGSAVPPPDPAQAVPESTRPATAGGWSKFREGRWGPSGWTVAYAVVLTLIVLVVGTAGPWSPVGFAEHRTCRSSLDLKNELLWTPIALENSPYGGWARLSVVLVAGPTGFETTSLNDSAGSASGLFSLDNWSVFQDSNATVLGPGPNLWCGERYSAVDESRGSGILAGNRTAGATLLPAGTRSDTQEPLQVNLSVPVSFFRTAVYPSTMFDDRFGSASEVTTSCGGQVLEDRASSSVTQIRVPFSTGGTTVLIPAVLPALVTYTYGLDSTFPGTISIDRGEGFGDAFSWTPCG